jgi:hypothetical protein
MEPCNRLFYLAIKFIQVQHLLMQENAFCIETLKIIKWNTRKPLSSQRDVWWVKQKSIEWISAFRRNAS